MRDQHNERAKRAFVWRYGVLYIGLPTAIFAALIGSVVVSVLLTDVDWRTLTLFSAVTVVVFTPVFGLYWGQELWKRRSRS